MRALAMMVAVTVMVVMMVMPMVMRIHPRATCTDVYSVNIRITEPFIVTIALAHHSYVRPRARSFPRLPPSSGPSDKRHNNVLDLLYRFSGDVQLTAAYLTEGPLSSGNAML